jgi:hypothetical protein
MEIFMKRLFALSSIVALATAVPAIAQQVDPVASPPAPAAPAPTEAPADLDAPEATQAAPVDAAAATTQPTPAAPTAEAAPAADARAASIAKLVEAEFPSYDADKTGDLNQAEFSKWVLALHAKAEEAQAATAMDEKAKATWAKNAFATADADKSKKISKTELQTFLLG